MITKNPNDKHAEYEYLTLRTIALKYHHHPTQHHPQFILAN